MTVSFCWFILADSIRDTEFFFGVGLLTDLFIEAVNALATGLSNDVDVIIFEAHSLVYQYGATTQLVFYADDYLV